MSEHHKTPDDTHSLNEMLEVLRMHEEVVNPSRSGTPAERLTLLVLYHRNKVADTLAGVRTFRDDLIVQFRALAIVIESAGNAQTHAEKNARLRGFSEIVEGAIARLRAESFDFDRASYRQWPDLFHSDFPYRHYLERIHQLEQEVQELKKTPAGRGEGENQGDQIPF